jgi:hypothetical protein
VSSTKKGNIKSDYQTSTEVVEHIPKMMRLLVTWKTKRSKELRVYTVLVEHDNELVWNEDKLAQLYDKINEQLSRRCDAPKSTWLVCDNTVLEVTYEVLWKVDPELKITISKGIKDWNTRPALWIDPERQVSSLMAIYIY